MTTMSDQQPPTYQMPVASDGVASGELRMGAVGQAVLQLQQLLIVTGLYAREPSGSFDEATQEAVRAFQQGAGLPATGVADTTTVGMLQASTASGAEVPAIGQSLVSGGQQGAANAQSTSAPAPQSFLSNTLAQWRALPLGWKVVAGVGLWVAMSFMMRQVRGVLSGGISGTLSTADVEAELSMQRRKCKAILPEARELANGAVVDAESFKVERD